MRAIIYAAGRGTRLGPTYGERPKVLLEFGGKSLLRRHAETLSRLSIAELIVVTGHRREDVLRELSECSRALPLRCRELFNPDFTEGSVVSFHASLPALRASHEPVLLMDGDVLYPPALLARLLESAHETVLLLDRDFSTADEDPVLVPLRDGRPVELRKKWRGDADAVGESVGFFKVAPGDLPLLIAETKRRSLGERRQEPYEEVLRALVLAGRFQAEDVTGLPWIEIDFPADVERAVETVLPAIVAMES